MHELSFALVNGSLWARIDTPLGMMTWQVGAGATVSQEGGMPVLHVALDVAGIVAFANLLRLVVRTDVEFAPGESVQSLAASVIAEGAE